MAGKREGGGGSFSGWLQRVRRTGEFSDITVLVEGQEFNLHTLPLLNGTLYFRNLPSSAGAAAAPSSSSPSPSPSSSSRRIVDLGSIPGGAEGFSPAADFCYLIRPTFTMENVAKIRAVAQYLGMAELQDSTKKFIYLNIFSHWRSAIAFLQQHKRLHAPVDEYMETRCLKVITASCTKAFLDTKYLSAPISLSKDGAWQSSPCQILTEILVKVTSLPDRHVSELVEELVSSEVNPNLKCRQGRNVKAWLESIILSECTSDRARCWVVILLTKMLERGVTSDRPWLELSSQYWCTLLHHAERLVKKAEDPAMASELQHMIKFLEARIGGSLHELDDYLLSYSFGPKTLLSLVEHFKQVEAEEVGREEMEEVAAEVDACVWSFIDTSSISAQELIFFIKAFPASCRPSHDMLYAGIEKLLSRGARTQAAQANEGDEDEDEDDEHDEHDDGDGDGDDEEEVKQRLWGLVDIAKLSSPCKERALRNSSFVSQPHILEYVLKQHAEELSNMSKDGGGGGGGGGDGEGEGRDEAKEREKLSKIMHKVVHASLKLLEENSRRSKEIMELRRQYAVLLEGGSKAPCFLQESCCTESSPDIIFDKSRMNGCSGHGLLTPDEVEDVASDTPARRSTCSSMELEHEY